jgi:hypothetical protein
MPPKSDRFDDSTDLSPADPAELKPPCDVPDASHPIAADPPTISADDADANLDRVVLAKWIAKSVQDAYPLIASAAQALEWSDERTEAAIVDGEKAGRLQRWEGGYFGPSVTLSGLEAKLRGLRVYPAGVGKGGKYFYKWKPINTPDPQAKGGMRLQDKTKIALTAELRYGGKAKTSPSKVPTLEKLARYSPSAHDYLVAAEYLGSHPREIAKAAGQNVLAGKASSGAILTGSGAAWPDPGRVRYEEPGQAPGDPGPNGPCPVCLSKEPTLAGYCLRCDKSGVDHVLPVTGPLPKDDPPRRGPDKQPRKRRVQANHGDES